MPTFTSADSTSTPTGSSRDWEPSARLVQLLQQVWQDRVCQSDEPPEHGACLLGTQEIQALPSQAHCQGFRLAARDSEQRPQSFLSLAERSDPKVMSMHKALSVKSRVRGDFHARFWERVRVKLPRSTWPWSSLLQGIAIREIGIFDDNCRPRGTQHHSSELVYHVTLLKSDCLCPHIQWSSNRHCRSIPTVKKRKCRRAMFLQITVFS